MAFPGGGGGREQKGGDRAGCFPPLKTHRAKRLVHVLARPRRHALLEAGRLGRGAPAADRQAVFFFFFFFFLLRWGGWVGGGLLARRSRDGGRSSRAPFCGALAPHNRVQNPNAPVPPAPELAPRQVLGQRGLGARRCRRIAAAGSGGARRPHVVIGRPIRSGSPSSFFHRAFYLTAATLSWARFRFHNGKRSEEFLRITPPRPLVPRRPPLLPPPPSSPFPPSGARAAAAACPAPGPPRAGSPPASTRGTRAAPRAPPPAPWPARARRAPAWRPAAARAARAGRSAPGRRPPARRRRRARVLSVFLFSRVGFCVCVCVCVTGVSTAMRIGGACTTTTSGRSLLRALDSCSLRARLPLRSPPIARSSTVSLPSSWSALASRVAVIGCCTCSHARIKGGAIVESAGSAIGRAPRSSWARAVLGAQRSVQRRRRCRLLLLLSAAPPVRRRHAYLLHDQLKRPSSL